jgi:hypothetical protein
MTTMVGNMAINVSNLAKRIKQRARMPRRGRVPNCTHINMDRVYGRDQLCDNCLRTPSMGFLYVCAQDAVPKPSRPRNAPIGDSDGSVDDATAAATRRDELEQIGVSESIIQTAERGLYTDAQLDLLKHQKLHLKQSIEDVTANRLSLQLLDTLTSRPSNTDGTIASMPLPEDPDPVGQNPAYAFSQPC